MFFRFAWPPGSRRFASCFPEAATAVLQQYSSYILLLGASLSPPDYRSFSERCWMCDAP